MPIYEYRCRTCDHLFQKLQPMSAGPAGVRCPRCDGSEVERQLSAFAAGSSTGSPSPPSGCAPAGGG